MTFNIEKIELLPCPFCGRQATIVLHPGINWDRSNNNINTGALFGTWYVGCSYPFFEDIDIGTKKRCEIKPSASWHAILENAVKEWNGRSNCNSEPNSIPR